MRTRGNEWTESCGWNCASRALHFLGADACGRRGRRPARQLNATAPRDDGQDRLSTAGWVAGTRSAEDVGEQKKHSAGGFNCCSAQDGGPSAVWAGCSRRKPHAGVSGKGAEQRSPANVVRCSGRRAAPGGALHVRVHSRRSAMRCSALERPSPSPLLHADRLEQAGSRACGRRGRRSADGARWCRRRVGCWVLSGSGMTASRSARV